MLGVESENTLKAAHCLHNRSASINSHKTVEMTVSQTSCHIIQRKILYPSKGRKGNFQNYSKCNSGFHFKGLVYLLMKCLSLFTPLNVVPNLYDFLYSVVLSVQGKSMGSNVIVSDPTDFQ